MPSFNYDDIINLPYPQENWNFRMKHPRMSVENRAKIFSPFAALRGHSAVIAATAEKKLAIQQDDLMEDSRMELDENLTALAQALQEGKNPIVSIAYFEQDLSMAEGKGCYRKVEGLVTKLDLTGRFIQVVELKIQLENIRSLVIKT